MALNIAGEHLPFVTNTNIQLQYRFPTTISGITDSDYIHAVSRIIEVYGEGVSVLLAPSSAGFLDIAKHLHAPADITFGRWFYRIHADDLEAFDTLTRHYDVIICTPHKWTGLHFELCQKNRCMVVSESDVRWDGGLQQWYWGRLASNAASHSPITIYRQSDGWWIGRTFIGPPDHTIIEPAI